MKAMDMPVKWFCILFGNPFSVDDVYDHCPADRMMRGIALPLLAVQAQTTGVRSPCSAGLYSANRA